MNCGTIVRTGIGVALLMLAGTAAVFAQAADDADEIRKIEAKLDEARVSPNFQQEPMSEIVKSLAREAGIRATFAPEAKAAIKCTLQLKNVTLRSAIDALLSPHGLSMTVEAKGIRVTLKMAEIPQHPSGTGNPADKTKSAAGDEILIPTKGYNRENLIGGIMFRYGVKHCPATYIVSRLPEIQTGLVDRKAFATQLNSDQIKERGQTISDEDWEKLFNEIGDMLKSQGFKPLNIGDMKERLRDDHHLSDRSIAEIMRTLIGDLYSLAPSKAELMLGGASDDEKWKRLTANLEQVARQVNGRQREAGAPELSEEQIKALSLFLSRTAETLKARWLQLKKDS